MQKHLLAPSAVALAFALALIGVFPSTAVAQEEEEEPQARWVHITSFSLPYHVRDKVIPYLIRSIVPANRLNPNVITFRVLVHNQGSDGSEMAFYREFAEFADIGAPCGEPCETFFEEHPAPEEGDEGYEEYEEAQELWQKYYSHHKDDIYTAPGGALKTEGEVFGPLWPEEEEEEGGS